MKVVIDTNSLLSLVRYYLPFDKKKILFGFFKQKIKKNEIIIIDKVLEECAYIAQGVVIKTLAYLQDKTFLKSSSVPYKTDMLLAPSPAKFIRQVENQFVNGTIRNLRNLTDAEFENQMNVFLNGADIKQIILCLNLNKGNQDVVLVTEETDAGNDNKLFKKIPAICKELNINTLTLPELLLKYYDIGMEFR